MDNLAAPIPPTSPQPAEVSTPAETPNRCRPLWLISGFALLTAGIAIGVFSAKFLNQSQNQSQLPSTPTASPSPQSSTPTPTPDPTVNWKIYINNKCRYEIKYPQSWTLLPEPENAIYGAAVIFPYEVGSGIRPPDDWLKVQIGCAVKASNRSPQNIVDELNKRDSGYGVSRVQSSGQINLNGSPGFKQLNIPPNGSSVLEYYVFPEGDRYYSLGFTPGDTKQTNIIDQILSTFKFTN